MSGDIPPQFTWMLRLSELAFEAAEAGVVHGRKLLRPRRRKSYTTRRPGPQSPLWNEFARILQSELKPYGSKVRLARYLDIPKQRLNDFLTGRSRLPDAELTLRLLNWLSYKRAGRDLSL